MDDEFEVWAIDAGFAYRNEQGFWFHRNGGDGLREAFRAGKCCAAAAADLLRKQNAIYKQALEEYSNGASNFSRAVGALDEADEVGRAPNSN